MNKIKTKIIAILAAVTVILSSCNSKTNEQPNVSSTPSSSISTVTPEKNEDNKTNNLKEETYKGKEIRVISVYNPVEEKENYFFVNLNQ